MTRKPDDWMPLVIGKYLANTAHLTRDQHGAYLLLLMAYWTNGGPLEADDGGLAATVKATPAEWRKLRPVLAKFFTERDGKWHQKKADEELTKAVALTGKKAAAGKKGADKRWHSDDSANGETIAQPSSSHRQTDAPLPLPLPEQAAAAVVAAHKAGETSEQINRLNKVLGFDDRDYTRHAENIRILIELKTLGCDFDCHILPAAQAVGSSRGIRSLNYIREKAIGMRDAAKLVASMPIPFENTDERGWADRMRAWRDKALWAPKWGPKPDEPGCKCPPDILNAKVAA